MLNLINGYLVIAGLFLVGVAIGKSRARKEIIYVIRQ